jgi:hypothetical protein
MDGDHVPPNNNRTGKLYESLIVQGIGVYFLIPENYREIQEFNHNRPKV